jgi:predicted AAA+ superfamily ATPase
MIERDIAAKIEPYLERKEFLAVIGPRQSGKTTFLEMLRVHLVKHGKVPPGNIHSATFEDRRLLNQFENDPVSFVESFPVQDEKKKVWLFLDEFQYAEEGGQKLKLIYDTIKNVKIVITGSSSLEIKAQVGKYMVGRVLSFHLYPFNFNEFLRSKGKRFNNVYDKGSAVIKNWLSGKKAVVKKGEDPFYAEMIRQYERYCVWGGYPAVVLSKNDNEKIKVLGDIYNNYVLKDIKGLLELDTEKNLYLLSRHLAVQSGNIVVYNNMAQAALLDFRQLKKHMAVLQETYICSEISPFFSNRLKELVKNPKVYFYDMGFRNYLVENMAVPENRPDGGALVENAVFVKLNQLKGDMTHIHFWRTKAGAEVDFIIKQNNKVTPIEVKYTAYSELKVPRGMLSFIEAFKPERGILFTKNYWGIAKAGNTEILFAPVYYL